MIAENNHINTIISLLKDSDSLVVLSAICLLRNISLYPNQEIISKVIDSIDTIIDIIRNNCLESFQDESMMLYSNSLLSNSFSLLSNLLDIEYKLSEYLNSIPDIYNSLLRVYHSSNYTPTTKIYCSQTLLIASETLPYGTTLNISYEQLQILKGNMANMKNPPLLRALLSAILIANDPQASTLKMTFPIIKNILSINIKNDLLQISTSSNDKESSLQLWKDNVNSQCIVLEALTNILADDEGDEEFVEMENESFSNFNNEPSQNVIEIHDVLKSNLNLMDTILNKCEDTEIENISDDIKHLLLQLKVRILGFIQNIINSEIYINPETYEKDCIILWNLSYKHFMDSYHYLSQNEDETIANISVSSSSIMAQLLRHVASYQQQFGTSFPISNDCLSNLFNIINQNFGNEEIQTNILSMLGIFGQYANESDIESIGVLLLKGLNHESLWISTEAANSLMDIFAEPTYNNIVQKLNIMSILNEFIPYLRSKIKSEKNKLDVLLLDRMDETCINLQRLIEYKQNQ